MARYYNHTLDDLRYIHGEVAAMRNGIRRASEVGWIEFAPSDFLYSFVVFNTLYNIDWDKSQNELIRYRDEDIQLCESEKQERFLGFCFSEDVFVEQFKEFFINYILQEGNGKKKEIMDTLENVRFDPKHKPSFLRDFDSLLSGNFTEEIIKSITNSLYHVRCNIFHGTKTIRDLNRTEQRKRLAIYTSFFVALNQMLFSFLDYKGSQGNISARIREAFEGLQKNRTNVDTPTTHRQHQPNK